MNKNDQEIENLKITFEDELLKATEIMASQNKKLNNDIKKAEIFQVQRFTEL